MRGSRDGGVNVHARHRAGRAAPDAVLARADEHAGAAIGLAQAAGDDANDARMPARGAEDQGLACQQRGVAGYLFLGGGVNLLGQQAAAAVQPFQLRGQDAGAALVCGGQQFHGLVGVVQAAQGVEAWGQAKADVVAVEVRRVYAGHVHQGAQPHAARLAQALQAELQQVARVFGLGGDVGHDAQRRQVQVGVSLFRGAAQQAIEFLHQFVGHADAGQFA